jgi:hypothetical protein
MHRAAVIKAHDAERWMGRTTGLGSAIRVTTLFAFALILTSCGLWDSQKDTSQARSAEFVVDLIPLGGEEPGGVVGLTRGPEGKTLIAVEVTVPAGSQVAEVGSGNCDVLGTSVYGLNPLLDGRSETTVDAPLRELRRAGYYVLVSDPGHGPGGLCGDLARSQPPSAAPTFR